MKKIRKLFFVAVMAVLGLAAAVRTEASEYKRVEDAVTPHSVVYLYPGSQENMAADLFEVKDDIAVGFLIYDGSSTVDILDVCEYSINCGIEEIGDCLMLEDGRVIFGGDEKTFRSLIGESFTVDYTIRANNGSSASYSVAVNLVEDAFAIHSESLGLVERGQSAEIELFAGSREYIDVTWSSSDPAVMTVKAGKSGKGTAIITGKKQGTVTISAKVKTDSQYETVSGEFTVNWRPGKAVLNFSKLSVNAGEGVRLLLSDLPDNSKVSFSSGKTSIATVDSKTGMITAKKAGTTTITVTVKAAATDYLPASTYKLKCRVTVNKAPKVTDIASAADLKKALTSGKGGSLRLTKDIKNFDDSIIITSGEYRLDLNGHSLQGKGRAESGLLLVNGGTLYMLDSKNKGSMANLGGQECVGCKKGKLFICGGTYAAVGYSLLVEGGTVKVYGGVFNGMSRAAYIFGGNLIIYGGEFNNTEDFDTHPELWFWEALSIGSGAKTVEINGGSFHGCDSVSINSDTASLTINHGSFWASVQCLDMSRGNAVINGGTFIADTEDGNTLNISPLFYTASLTVNGGVFYGTRHNIYTQNEAYVIVNGGIFNRDSSGWNKKVEIVDTHCGIVQLAAGLIPSYEIMDNTPAGQGLIATSFRKNKTTYTKDMTITKPDDAYSAFIDAVSNLNRKISFYCNRDIYKVVAAYAMEDWIEYRHGGSYMSYDYDSATKLYHVTIEMDYLVNFELDRISENSKAINNAGKAAKKYSEKIDGILKSCLKKGMTDREKATAIHNYMCKQYKYDYSFAEKSYTIEGLLDDNTGVCQAYALLFKTLCRRAGIECDTIEGVAGEPGKVGLHMWNSVVIDGKTLYCDVTFDDGAGTDKWLLKDYKTFYGYGYHY